MLQQTLLVLIFCILFQNTLPQTPKAEPLCLNNCNRRGECNSATASCMCQEGYIGPDCSQRSCPVGFPWSKRQSRFGSSPLYTPRDTMVECSNAGTCDHSQGRCLCFTGFGGQACERTRCMPFSSSGGNCTGHGQCLSMASIHKLNAGFGNTGAGSELIPLGGAASGDAVYRQWDSERIYGCACDKGFSGPDCHLALCPAGDSPRTRFQQRRVVRIFAQVPAATNPSSLRFRFWFAGQTSSSIDVSTLNTENCQARILSSITTINASASSCRVVVGGRLDVVRNITIGGSKTSVIDSDGDLATGSFEAVLAIGFSSSVGGLSQQSNLFPFTGSPPISLFGCYVDSAYSTSDLRASVSCRVEDVSVTSLSIVPAGSVRIPSGVSYDVTIHDSDVFPNKAVVTKIVRGAPALVTSFPPILLTTRPQGIRVSSTENLYISFGSLWGHTKDATWKITSPNDVETNVPIPPSSILGIIKSPSTREHEPCSGQGLCNEESGLCECFTGSSGVACETLASVPSSRTSSDTSENDPALLVEAIPTNFAGVVLQVSSARPLSSEYNFIECADKGGEPSFLVDGLGRVETTGLDVTGATYLRRSLLVHMSEPLAKTFNDKVGVLSVHYGSSTRSPGRSMPVLAVSSEFPRTGGYFNSSFSLRFDEFGNPVPFTDPSAYSIFRVGAREFVDSYGEAASNAGIQAETSLFDVRGDGIVTSRYGLRVTTGGLSVYSGGIGLSGGLLVSSGTTLLNSGIRVKGGDMVLNGTLFTSSNGKYNDLFEVDSSTANELKGKVGLVTDSILVTGGVTSLLGEIESMKGIHISAGGLDVTRGGITVDYGGISVYTGGAIIGTGSMSVLGGGLYAANDEESPSITVKLARGGGGISSGTAGSFSVESSIQSNNPRYVAILADSGGAGGSPNEPFASIDPSFHFSRLQNLVAFITTGIADVRLTSFEIFVTANASDLFSISATLYDVVDVDPTINDDSYVKVIPASSGPAFPAANASAYGSVSISNQTVELQELIHVELAFMSGSFPLLLANKTYAIKFSAKSETGDKSPTLLYAASSARSQTYIQAVKTVAGDFGITISNLTALRRDLISNSSVLDPLVAAREVQNAFEDDTSLLISNRRAYYGNWKPAYNVSDYNQQIFTLALAVLGGPPSDPPLPGFVANTGYAGDVVAIAGPLASQSGLYNVLALRAGAVDGTDGGKALLIDREMDIQSSDTFVLTTKDVIMNTAPSGDISLAVGSSFGRGGKIALKGGNGYSQGGDAILQSGDGIISSGGNAFVFGGRGGSAGGNVIIQPGTASNGNNGNVYINDAYSIPRITVNGNGDIIFSPSTGSTTSLVAAANPIMTYATYLSLIAKTTVVVKGDNAQGGLSPGNVLIKGGDSDGSPGGSISIAPGVSSHVGYPPGFIQVSTANTAGLNTKRVHLGPEATSGGVAGGLRVFADDSTESFVIEYGSSGINSEIQLAGSLSVAGSVNMYSGASISGGGLTVGPHALFNGHTSVQGGLFSADQIQVSGLTSLKGAIFTDGCISVNALSSDLLAANFNGPINVLGTGIISLTTLQATGDIISKTGDLILEAGEATFNEGATVLDKFIVMNGGASFFSTTEPTIFSAGVSIGGVTSLHGNIYVDEDAELKMKGKVTINDKIVSTSLFTASGNGIYLPSSSSLYLDGGTMFVTGSSGAVSIGDGGLKTSGGLSIMDISRFDKSVYFGATVTSQQEVKINAGDLTLSNGRAFINGGVSIGGSLSTFGSINTNGNIISSGGLSLISAASLTVSSTGVKGSPNVIIKGEDDSVNGGGVSIFGGKGGVKGGSVILRGGRLEHQGSSLPGTVNLQDWNGVTHLEVSTDGSLFKTSLSLSPTASLLSGGNLVVDGQATFNNQVNIGGSLTAGRLSAGFFGAQMITFCIGSAWTIGSGGSCDSLSSVDPSNAVTVKLYFNADSTSHTIMYGNTQVVIPPGSIFPIYFI
jgi:hypothetical protein